MVLGDSVRSQEEKVDDAGLSQEDKGVRAGHMGRKRAPAEY